MISCCAAAILLSGQVNAQSYLFDKAAFEKIKQQHIGKQWLLILWSVDCPPCFQELALIEKMRKQQPEVAVVIVNADDTDEISAEREKIIAAYHLSTLANYHFGDGLSDQSRYIIDSHWYGELPRSYFVEANGTFHGKSGLVSEKSLVKWLAE